ncbi:MAG: hypothetical protein V3U54_06525 [Thermodesulfobacteriota bacterium]
MVFEAVAKTLYGSPINTFGDDNWGYADITLGNELVGQVEVS